MGKIIIKIDWVPNNFGAAPLNEHIACVATGTTLEDVKKNIVEALEFHIEGMKADGDTIPEELSSPLGARIPAYYKGTPQIFRPVYHTKIAVGRNGDSRAATKPLCQWPATSPPGHAAKNRQRHPIHLPAHFLGVIITQPYLRPVK